MITYVCKNKKLLIAILTIGCILYYYIDPAEYSFIPKCPVKIITGFDCPGCGFQRALHASLHGNFKEAINYNLFLIVAVPLTVLWWLIYSITYKIKQPHVKIMLIRFNKSLIYFYVFSYFAWFIMRNSINI